MSKISENLFAPLQMLEEVLKLSRDAYLSLARSHTAARNDILRQLRMGLIDNRAQIESANQEDLGVCAFSLLFHCESRNVVN